MDFSKLVNKVKDLAKNEKTKEIVKKVANSDAAKKVAKKITGSKSVKNATKNVTKIAKSVKIDLASLISLATKNTAVITALGKLGLKKDADPASSQVQKLVSTLKSAVVKATGTKVDDDKFGSMVNKLMGNVTIKKKVEAIAGSGVSTFIKKAVSEFIS